MVTNDGSFGTLTTGNVDFNQIVQNNVIGTNQAILIVPVTNISAANFGASFFPQPGGGDIFENGVLVN